MAISACDSALLGGLFGDAAVAGQLDEAAELAALIRFEAALARVEARLGVIPAAAGPAISLALHDLVLDPADLRDATADAGVSVPGLVKALRAQVGAPHGDFLHWGATSQDAADTGLVLRLRVILEELATRLNALVARLAELADHHAGLPMAGRTRSQIATPTTFGLRLAGWRAPLARCLDRLAELRPRLLVVQLGGATGNLSVLADKGIAVMQALAEELDLGCPAKPWHTERDTMVELANWLAMVSGLLGRIGADLIVLGRSEIGEVRTGGGGGSSTMPQKANPVRSEALVTLARVNGAQAGLAQQALLHIEERDGASWSLEWLCLPQMMTATAAGLRHANILMAALEPVPERMAAAIEMNGGAAHAEAMAFALAQQMPLPEAQAILKAAAQAQTARGGTLADHVAEACRARGVAVPDPGLGSMVEGCRALVRRAIAVPG